jgi:flagellar motor switch/type III secretory pathway protein FliN
MAADNGWSELDAFGDLAVRVEARIGKCVMKVEEIAAFQCGSTIPLDRSAGEAFDLMVGNLRMGTVEVVANEDRLTVRIMQLFLPDVRTVGPGSNGLKGART